MGLGDLSVTKSLFGSGSSPGVMGTGQQRFTAPQMGNVKRDANGNPIIDITQQPGESNEDYTKRAERFFNGDQSAGNVVYETDPYKAWQDPQAEARRAQLDSQLGKYENRQLTGDARIDRAAIERYGGAQVAPAERINATQIGQFERGQQAQLAPAERMQAERVGDINIGQAQGYGGATVDPAAQARAAQLGRQDAQFRSAQMGLTNQLQEQAAGRGPSLAEGQLRAATDRNLKQQQAAAAASGGPSALAARGLRIGAAQQGQEAAQAAAQMRIQEQLAARQQLAGVAQTGREQDINVANAQAQLQQQTALANQAAINQRAGQQAGLTQQAGIFSAEQMNARQYQQAQLQAQLALANQQAGMTAAQANQAAANQFALQQGSFGQQMNLANMQAFNERQFQQAQLGQQANLANQQYANQFALQQGAWQQQAGLANQQYSNQALFANQQAAMQQQQLNDAMARYYTEAGLSLDARQQQAMMAYQALQQQQALGYAGLEQKAYEGAREGIGGFMGGIGSAIGSLAMFSDEEVKNSVTRGDDKIGQFLQQYMSGTNDLAQQYATSPSEKSGGGGLLGGLGGGISSAGAMSAMGAMSDQKAKDLSAENDKLKAQMVGMSMQKGAGGKGFLGGLGGGIAAGAQAKMMQDKNAAANAPKKADPSSQMTPVMNNPNAAIAVPGGPQGAAMMAPNYGGLPVRENPYGASAPQTWGGQMTPPSMGTQGISTEFPTGGYAPTATPEEVMRGQPWTWQPGYAAPMQTWGVPSDKNMKEYSPPGMKMGIGSGDMKISNFLKSIGGNAGSGPSDPMDYGQSMSDKFSKKKVEDVVEDKIKNFLNEQHAYEYEYKPEYKNMPGAGHGRFVSTMAQNVQNTELGESAVKPGPNGMLMIDYGKLSGVMLASQAYLQNRLNEIEAKIGKK